MDSRDCRRYTVAIVLFLVGLLVALNWVSRVEAGRYLLSRSPAEQGEEFAIVQGTSNLFRPAIAGGDLVVWYAHGDDGLDVFALSLDEKGRAQGVPIVIGGGAGDQTVPAVAPASGGRGYLVVWHSRSHTNADFDVYARWLDDEGQPMGEPFPVSEGMGDQLRPAVAYARAAGAFIVAWQDNRSGKDFDLYVRLVRPPGREGGEVVSLSQEFVASTSVGNQLTPAVACEVEDARCLTVWMDDRNADTLDTDVIGRLIDVTRRSVVGDEIDVAVEKWYQDSPTVVYNPVSDVYMVVWNDDVGCRHVDRWGQLPEGRIDVSLESPFQYKPAVAIDADGNYLIIWEDGRHQESRGTDIYGQWLSPDGRPKGRNFALSAEGHNQYSPVLSFRPDLGAFLAVWEDDREYGNDYLVLYGQILSDGSTAR